MVLEEVIGYNIIKSKKDTYYRSRMKHKTVAAHQLPRMAIVCIGLFGLHRAPIAEGAEQRTDKSGDHKKMAQFPGPQMLSYELCIQSMLSL